MKKLTNVSLDSLLLYICIWNTGERYTHYHYEERGAAHRRSPKLLRPLSPAMNNAVFFCKMRKLLNNSQKNR